MAAGNGAWRISLASATLHPVKDVIVLIAHGTVEDLDEMPEFLLEIRRGRPVPPGLLEEMCERYDRVGGSPLLRETKAQALAVEQRMGIETRVAMRLWTPRLAEVMSDLSAEDRAVLVPMAPYSVQIYEAAALRELQKLEHPPRLRCVPPWGEGEDLVAAHADQIKKHLSGEVPERTHLVLTAHSLPSVVIQRGDPYARQFESAARAVASRLEFPTSIAYQSQGADGGDWQGPGLNTVIREVSTSGVDTVAVAPIGFLCEHIETLYDLDIETKALVEGLGKRFCRVPALGTHGGLIRAIEQAVKSVA